MMSSGLTRRLVLIALMVMTAVLPASAAETFTYTYGDFSAELPVDPQRVVVLDNRLGIEFSLLAGFPILAVGLPADSGSPLEPLLPPGVGRMFDVEPNAEQILSYDPDLVVVDRGMWDWYQTEGLFSGAGFNVLVVEGSGKDDWRKFQQEQLDAYGRGDRGIAAMAEYDAAVAAARPEIERILAGRPIVVGGELDGSYWLQVGTYNTSIANDLGIATVVGDAPTDGGYQFYSAETLAPFDGAALLLMQSANDTYRQNPLWQRLSAADHTVNLHWLRVYGFSIAARAFVDDVLAAVKTLEQ